MDLSHPLLFGVLSDLHLLDPALGLPEGAARSALFRTALARFRDRGVDGVLVCGDLTNNGFVTELEEVARVWFEVFPEGRLPDGRRVANLMLYGDHDMEGRIRKGERVRRLHAERELPLPPGLDEGDNRSAVWESLFHEPWAPFRRVTVKGHDFLLRSFAPEYMGRSPGLAEAVAQVRAENPDRPFFYAQHRTIPGTCRFRDHLWGAEDGAGDCRRVLDGSPDGVAFFGHTHSSLADEQSAWQGGFTAVNAGGFVNAALPRGRENSTAISWLADDPAPFAQMSPVPAAAGHDAMLVAVDGWRQRALDYRVRVETLANGEPRLLLEKRVLTPGANRPEFLDSEPPSCVFSRAELAAPGPIRFTVAPANAWGQEGASLAAYRAAVRGEP